MKFDKVLLASDYDGTLYDNNGIIPAQVREAIAYFIMNGGRFTVCTGRTYQGFHAYESSYINAPVLLGNGAMAYDYEQEKVIFTDGIGEEIFGAIRAVRDNFPKASIEMYPFKESYIIHLSDTSIQHFKALKMEYKIIDDPSEAKLPWVKAMIYADEKSLEIQDFLRANFPSVHFLTTVGTYIELLQTGTDKGTGLLRLADSLGIPHERTFSIGDGFNDVEMLVAAKIGFVPSNGSPEALGVAGRVVRSNDEGAVANAIEILDEMF